MSNVFLKCFNLSITAGWLILAVILVRLLLKKAPKRIICVLWALVALRLIFPFSIKSTLSLIPSAQTVNTTHYAARPYIQSGVGVIDDAANDYLGGHYFEGVTVAMPDSPSNPINVLSVVWLIGIAALLLYALISFLRLKKSVAASIPVKDNILACDEVKSPFILGIIKPRIYVPSSMKGETLAHVISHETAHIRRRDHWWKPLGFLLLAIYWFNPLCWVAFVLLCRDMEMACDEKVIRDMDKGSVAEYSQALLDCSFPRRRIAACPLAFGEVGVKERVRSVLNYKKPAFWIIVAAVVTCIVVAVCFLTDPKSDVPLAASENDKSEPGRGAYVITISKAKEELTHGIVFSEKDTVDFCTVIALSENDWVNDISNCAASCYISLEAKNGKTTYAYSNSGVIDDLNNMRSLKLSDANRDKVNGIISKYLDTGIIVTSGENVAPVVVLSADIPVAELKDHHLHWIDILPEQESFVPFQIFCDGNELNGMYSVYDAETLEPLSFFMPSGLAPQTYIFHSAQPGRAYIVTMKINSDMYCFGARLPASGEAPSDSPTLKTAALREKYPEYFDLPTDKGLEVYVWQMSRNSYSFGLLPGTGSEKTLAEPFALKGASAQDMKAILSTYDLDERDIRIIPWQNPISSYASEYLVSQEGEPQSSIDARRQEYLDIIRSMLFD